MRNIISLQQRTEQVYRTMEEWMRARFLAEMKSINQLTELVRQHIETGVQIHHELVLQSTDFCVDEDTSVHQHLLTADPCWSNPKTAHSPSDNCMCSVLSCARSPLQVEELVCILAEDSEMLDWRQFLLSAALPWPLPSQTQLLKTLQRYRDIDTAGTGLVTQEQYEQVELWFAVDQDLSVSDHPTEPVPYNRLANLKKFFFNLFASTHSSQPMLDYLKMLLYVCCHPELVQGFTRALGLIIGHTLHYKRTTPLTQSVPYMEGAGVEECDTGDEEEESEEVGVSVDDVLRVLSHGEDQVSHLNRFQLERRSRDELREELLKVFKELGFRIDEKIPFSTLSQHPFLQDLIEGSSQFLLHDIHKFFQTQQTEDSRSIST